MNSNYIVDGMLLQARQQEIDVQSLHIEHRREWAELLTVDKLEHALTVARQRLIGATQRLSQVR